MEIDRRAFITSVGGAAALAVMTSEQKADALERYLQQQLDDPEKFPTVAELEATNQDLGRPSRRGAGNLFVPTREGKLRPIEKMPDKPTLLDFFQYRFAPANHVLQSATRALKTGMREEIVLACLLHDVVLNMIHPDHGWWGASLVEPYVPEITTFAIRYHQTLRFYPDTEFGYEYPESYFRTVRRGLPARAVPAAHLRDGQEPQVVRASPSRHGERPLLRSTRTPWCPSTPSSTSSVATSSSRPKASAGTTRLRPICGGR